MRFYDRGGQSLTCGCCLQVRSAVPMYLLSRKIKAGGFKVVLSGEGADEIYGGYLFFHKAPSPRAFHECAAFFTLHHLHHCWLSPGVFRWLLFLQRGAVPAQVAHVRPPFSTPFCLVFGTQVLYFGGHNLLFRIDCSSSAL